MRVRSLLVCGILFGCVSWLRGASAPAGDEIERVFPVKPGCTVRLDTYRGVVDVEPSDAAEVRLTLALDATAESDAAAERVRSGFTWDAHADGNTVTIVARNPRETGLHFTFGDQGRLDLFFQLTVPRSCNLELNVNTGGITVGQIAGNVRAEVETGNIFCRAIEGAVTARSEIGDVIVSRCTGPVKARVLRGAIRLGTMRGPLDLENTTGDIEVLTAENAIDARTTAGDLTVGFPATIRGPVRLVAGGGNLYAKLTPQTACTIDASSVWGHVNCKLPVVGEAGANGRRRLVGRINGGGPVLSLHANGGSVLVTPDATIFDPALR